MSKLMMLTTAVALIILIANSTYVGFVIHNNKNKHDPQLQNAFAQALHSRQKPTTSFASEAIAPVLLGPISISGNNVYVVWSSNKTGNYEIMFRASSDNGQTFGNKINLSNSTSDSQNVDIQSSGDRVFVTWWEHNSTINEPVLRISTNAGKTFGSILKLSSNGSINAG